MRNNENKSKTMRASVHMRNVGEELERDYNDTHTLQLIRQDDRKNLRCRFEKNIRKIKEEKNYVSKNPKICVG